MATAAPEQQATSRGDVTRSTGSKHSGSHRKANPDPWCSSSSAKGLLKAGVARGFWELWLKRTHTSRGPADLMPIRFVHHSGNPEASNPSAQRSRSESRVELSTASNPFERSSPEELRYAWPQAFSRSPCFAVVATPCPANGESLGGAALMSALTSAGDNHATILKSQPKEWVRPPCT